MLRILIAGAGIGGLTLVRALRDSGHSIEVAERAPAFNPAGVGIVLHPNGMDVLARLGLAEEIARAGNPLLHLEIVRGESTLALPLAEIWEGANRPTIAILRTALHQALADSVRVSMGRRVVRVESPERRPVAHFGDGGHEAYDLIVGADGVHSAIRQCLFPGAAAVSTHLLYFRFPARNVIGLSPDTWRTVERPGASYGFIPVTRDLLHCFVQVRAEENPCPPGAEEAYFRSAFAEWDGALQATLDARCGAVHAGFAYMTRPVTWGRGACVLLGDSAHAVSPTLSEGGSLAMEDALILALALRRTDNIAEAIALYRSARQERVLWAHRMALSQVNSSRLRRPVPQLNPGVAARHMRAMYGPLRNAVQSDLLFPESTSKGETPHG